MIGEIIKEKRKNLKLTQEQVAEYLGVTTPAVNKWEKGVSQPDIALLAPLARLLKTDVNTLLGYQSELTEQELCQMDNEIMKCIGTDGFAQGLALARAKMQEFPNNGKLIHNLALLLDGMLMVSDAEQAQKEQWQEEIFTLYQQLFTDDDVTNNDSRNAILEIKNSAAFMLASKYIAKNRLKEAQEMIDFLPNHSAMDKRMLQANLYSCDGLKKEAEAIHERMLLSDATNLWNHLLVLIELAIEENDLHRANVIGDICFHCAEILDFPDYYQIIPQMELAALKKEKERTLDLMEALFQSVQTPLLWNYEQKILYRYVLDKKKEKGESKETEAMNFSILPALLAEINTNQRYAFLRRSKRFKTLIQHYESN